MSAALISPAAGGSWRSDTGPGDGTTGLEWNVQERTRRSSRPAKPCRIPDCPTVGRVVRGLCGAHYHRLKRYGDPMGGVRTLVKGLDAAAALARRSVRVESGCLEMVGGAFDKDGYATVHFAGQGHRAHRVAWEVANGRQVPDGYLVRHRCDNPPCVEPAHLLLGMVADNVADKVERHRQQWGHGRHRQKLTWERVAEMRTLMARGMSDRAAAAEFGVHRTMANQIRRLEKWNPALANPERPDY